MTKEVKGIHELPDRKLGARPNNPDKQRLGLARFLATMPDHPIVDPAPPLEWPMDHNDEWGDCVVAGLDHALQAISYLLGVKRDNFTTEKLIELYKTQNPGFDPNSLQHGGGSDDDQGMIIQDFLAEAVRRGYILGFAEVDTTNPDEVRAATYLGLGVITGEMLQVAQQKQSVWDFVPGSREWGGHCTVWVGYDTNNHTTVSWGEALPMTDAFVRNQVSEAWFIVTKEHVANPSFRNHFDLQTFADAYTAITGRPFPVAADPAPAPVDPGTGAGFQVSTAVASRIGKTAARRKVTPDAWLDAHLRSYFGLPRS